MDIHCYIDFVFFEDLLSRKVDICVFVLPTRLMCRVEILHPYILNDEKLWSLQRMYVTKLNILQIGLPNAVYRLSRKLLNALRLYQKFTISIIL